MISLYCLSNQLVQFPRDFVSSSRKVLVNRNIFFNAQLASLAKENKILVVKLQQTSKGSTLPGNHDGGQKDPDVKVPVPSSERKCEGQAAEFSATSSEVAFFRYVHKVAPDEADRGSCLSVVIFTFLKAIAVDFWLDILCSNIRQSMF